MEEYGRIATEEIHRQWSKGINPAIYNNREYWKPGSKLISKIKLFFEALFHLVLFKPYTIMPRILEVLCGILIWICIIIICYPFNK